MHVFGSWEEAGVTGEDPHRHRENMYTPYRKALGWNEAHDLPTVRQQCQPLLFSHNGNKVLSYPPTVVVLHRALMLLFLTVLVFRVYLTHVRHTSEHYHIRFTLKTQP